MLDGVWRGLQISLVDTRHRGGKAWMFLEGAGGRSCHTNHCRSGNGDSFAVTDKGDFIFSVGLEVNYFICILSLSAVICLSFINCFKLYTCPIIRVSK